MGKLNLDFIMSRSSTALKRSLVIGFGMLLVFSLCQTGFAQIDFPTPDPGQQTPDPVTPDPITPDNGNNNNGGDGGVGPTEITPQAVEPIRLEREIDDVRNQGFVGATGQIMEAQGFIGAIGDDSNAPPLQPDRSLGGNVNGNSNAIGLANNPGAQDNGFRVARRSIRAKLVPSFSAPQLSDFDVESRFVSHISRQPVVNQIGQGLTIRVSNKTATITGIARSSAELRILEQQLRLEPGIYKIDNRAQLEQVSSRAGAMGSRNSGEEIYYEPQRVMIPGQVVSTESDLVPAQQVPYNANGTNGVFVEAPRPMLETVSEPGTTPNRVDGGY
jgi:hypothetical protein